MNIQLYLLICLEADLKLKHWSADGHSSMTFEAALDHVKNPFSDGHLEGVVVSCTLNFMMSEWV